MATGAPWKLPPETMSPVVGEHHRVVGRGVGLDRRASRATKRERVARRAVHLRRAAHRVGVLHAAAVLVRRVDRAAGSSAQMLAADAAGPDAAARRGCAPRTDGSSRAARRSTARRRCRRRAPGARRRPAPAPATAVDGCVPLMSASPSFGPSVHRRAAPRARERVRAGATQRRRVLVAVASTSPSPISTSARCASGARSPLAPTDPRRGTTRMHAAVEQRDQRVERLAPDAGEALREDVRAQHHRRAHGAHRQRLADAGGVAAQQVELQRRRARSGGILTSASEPKPVLMP